MLYSMLNCYFCNPVCVTLGCYVLGLSQSNPSAFMKFVVATLGVKTAVQFEARNVVLILQQTSYREILPGSCGEIVVMFATARFVVTSSYCSSFNTLCLFPDVFWLPQTDIRTFRV